MRALRVLTTILVFGSTLVPGRAAAVDARSDRENQAAAAEARTAARELMTTVRALLAKALAAGGPEGAIHICADSAQVVGKRIQKTRQLSIRRVSEKWRNRGDVPDAYEKTVLKQFAEVLRGGASPDTVETVQIVGQDSARVLRYMKPIVVGEMCLSCHGEVAQMKPSLTEALRLRYPDDTAVNYSTGDLRGAVSVTVPLGR